MRFHGGGGEVVGGTGIEPVTPAMSRQCSTAEPTAHPIAILGRSIVPHPYIDIPLGWQVPEIDLPVTEPTEIGV